MKHLEYWENLPVFGSVTTPGKVGCLAFVNTMLQVDASYEHSDLILLRSKEGKRTKKWTRYTFTWCLACSCNCRLDLCYSRMTITTARFGFGCLGSARAANITVSQKQKNSTASL